MNSSYGGILIIWDRLFGSFVQEIEDSPHDYGIPELIESTNPISITFFEWKKLLLNTAKHKSLAYLFRAPKWKYCAEQYNEHLQTLH